MPNNVSTKPATLDRRIPGSALKSMSMSGKAIGVASVPLLEGKPFDVAPPDICLLERLAAGIRNIGEPRR